MKYRVFIVLLLVVLGCDSADGQTTTNASANPDTTEGRRLYEGHCAMCHGIDGRGGRGPALTRPRLTLAQSDSALRALIADGKDPAMPAAWYLTDQEVAEVADYVRSFGKVAFEKPSGDPHQGHALYEKLGCSGCHTLRGQGSGFGPDLTSIYDRRSATFVRETIQDPAATLPIDFQFVRLVTRSGQSMEGIRLNEDTFSIQIKDANGQPRSFLKSNLKIIRKLREKTPMPSFRSALTPKQFDDLVSFLMSAETQ